MGLETPYHAFQRIIKNYNENRKEGEPELPVIPLHGLRHTAATLLISQKVDIRTVSGRLGHANASTTLNIYSHALKELDKTASEKLGDMLLKSGSWKSPVDNRSTKPEKMGILSCQKIKKNRRPTHYECVALPAEPRKLIKRFALTHTLYTGFPDLASVFWKKVKKVKLIYFWKKLEKSSWQSGGSGVLYSLSPMKLIELFKQFKQLQLLNLSKKDKKVVDKQKKLW